MPWTASVTNAIARSDDPGAASVAVHFSDGTNDYTLGASVRSQAELDAWVLSKIAQFTAIETLVGTLPPGTPLNTTPLTPPDPPADPNAGLAQLTIGGLLSLLSEQSIARLNTVAGALDALRRDVLSQDRPSITHWIAMFAARPTGDNTSVGIITQAEGGALISALAAKA